MCRTVAGFKMCPWAWGCLWIWRLPTGFGDVPGCGGCWQLGGNFRVWRYFSVCQMYAAGFGGHCWVWVLLPGVGCVWFWGLFWIWVIQPRSKSYFWFGGAAGLEAVKNRLCPCRGTSQCIPWGAGHAVLSGWCSSSSAPQPSLRRAELLPLGGSELTCSEVKFYLSLLEYLGAVPTSLSALPWQIMGCFWPEFNALRPSLESLLISQSHCPDFPSCCCFAFPSAAEAQEVFCSGVPVAPGKVSDISWLHLSSPFTVSKHWIGTAWALGSSCSLFWFFSTLDTLEILLEEVSHVWQNWFENVDPEDSKQSDSAVSALCISIL